MSGPVGSRAALLLVGSWLLLALGNLAAGVVGLDVASFGVFVLCGAWVGSFGRPPGIVGLRRGGWAVPGLVVGFLLLPALLAGVWAVGNVLGFDPVRLGPPRPPGHGGPLGWVSLVVLAPLFEESLYRGWVLFSLRRRFGGPAAMLASSGLFAVTHVEPWAILGTFGVGLFLSAVVLTTRSLALCVGIHAGLNLAGVACGVPATRWAPSLSLSVVVACAFVGWLASRRAAAPARGRGLSLGLQRP